MALSADNERRWVLHQAAMLDAMLEHRPIPHLEGCGAVDACTCLGMWVEGIQRVWEEELIRRFAPARPPGMSAVLWDAYQRRRPDRAWNAYLDRNAEEGGR